jgi:uncharacterized protein YndB with AHSA1/START domain
MSNADLARFVDRYTIEYVRTFTHPIERVWKAIVDPAEIGQWFERPTKWDLREGGSFRFHDDYLAGPILAFEPPRLIRFRDNVQAVEGVHWFEFELEPVDGGTRLRFTHHVPPGAAREGQVERAWDTPWWPGLLEGWHSALDGMADVMDGVPIGSRHPPTTGSLEVRRRERTRALQSQYRAHVDATLPPGPPRPAQASGG